MPSPTLIATYSSAYNSSASPKTVSVTTQAGDFVVVYAGSENGANSFNTPTGNSISFTLNQSVNIDNTWADASIWSGFDTTGGSNWTLSVSRTAASQFYGFTCLVFRNCGGAGASNKTNFNESTAGTAQVSITTTRPSSSVVVFSADWNTTSANNRTWNTVNGITPTSSNGYETSFFYGSSTYIALGAYYPDAGAVGANNYGYSSTSTKKYSLVALEVLGTPSPIAAYSFNATGTAGGTLATSSSIADDSGNSNTLVTQSSAMSIVNGKTNVGVEANGSTYAEVQNASAIKPTTAVTIMCWIRATGTTWSWGQVFGRNNDETSWGEAFSLYLNPNYNPNMELLFHINVDGTSSMTDLFAEPGTQLPAINTWVHIACTWSAADGTMRFFQNGTQTASTARSGAALYYGSGGNTTRYFSIFRNTQYNEIANYIQIDDVRVFDTALNTTEITRFMNAPVAGGSPTTTIPFNWITGING